MSGSAGRRPLSEIGEVGTQWKPNRPMDLMSFRSR